MGLDFTGDVLGMCQWRRLNWWRENVRHLAEHEVRSSNSNHFPPHSPHSLLLSLPPPLPLHSGSRKHKKSTRRTTRIDDYDVPVVRRFPPKGFFFFFVFFLFSSSLTGSTAAATTSPSQGPRWPLIAFARAILPMQHAPSHPIPAAHALCARKYGNA